MTTKKERVMEKIDTDCWDCYEAKEQLLWMRNKLNEMVEWINEQEKS